MKRIIFLLIFLSNSINADVSPELVQKAFRFLSSIEKSSSLEDSFLFLCDKSTSVTMETFDEGNIKSFAIENSKGHLSRSFMSFHDFGNGEQMRLGKSLNNGDVQSIRIVKNQLKILVHSYNYWASRSRYRITITLEKEDGALKLYRVVWEEKKSWFSQYKHFLTQECK